MRLWITLSLIAFAVGCAGKEEGTPGAKAPVTEHAGHADHAMSSKDGHGEHEGHEKMNMATPRKLVVVGTDPLQPQPGSPTKLVLQIQDDDGMPIKTFDMLHEKLVHLIVVREGLDEFAHLHPEVDDSGTITAEFAFPKSGKYRLFADHQPQGKSPGLATGELIVTGDDDPAAALVPNTSHEVVVDEIKAHIAIKPGGQETTVGFHLVNVGDSPVDDLQPYLGAMGHLVIISADGHEYVHAHPLSESKTAPDGVVEFAAHFPKPGTYKAWGQFQRDGSVFTVPFVVKHEDQGHPHGRMQGMGPAMMGGRPGMGMGMMGGRPGAGNMADMRRDMQGLLALLDCRDEIVRQIKDLPNGVETVTESDDEQVAKSIREHVAAMYKRLERNEPMPMMTHNPLFVEVFKHAAKIEFKLEETPKGLKVIETFDDPYVARLIQAHARVVDLFMANGTEEVHREHEVPKRNSTVDSAQ